MQLFTTITPFKPVTGATFPGLDSKPSLFVSLLFTRFSVEMREMRERDQRVKRLKRPKRPKRPKRLKRDVGMQGCRGVGM